MKFSKWYKNEGSGGHRIVASAKGLKALFTWNWDNKAQEALDQVCVPLK